MKVGFIYLRTKASNNIVPSMVPNGVGYLASYIRKYHGIEDIFVEAYIDKLIQKKPDVVGISAVSFVYPLAKEYAKAIKELSPKTKVILGGSHITYVNKKLNPYFDAGVISEGEEQFGELVNLIQKNEFNPDKLKEIPGIVFRNENGETITTGKREWIQDLDVIPQPDRKMLSEMALKAGDTDWSQYIITSRGCPFTCEYCSTTLFWEKVRAHSVERVVEEVSEIVKHYPDQEVISISDDLFGFNRKRLKALVDLIKSEGLNKKVAFSCQTRASCFTDETAYLFKEMNVRYVSFGLESANERVLKFLKGNGSPVTNQKAINLCNKYGLNVLANFIVGSPTETAPEMADTYWFIRRNMKNVSIPFTGCATPFPGTKWWHYAENMGLVDDSFEEWNRLNLRFDIDNAVFINGQMKIEEFAEISKKFNDISDNKINEANETAQLKLAYQAFYKKQTNIIIDNLNNLTETKENIKILEINSFPDSLGKEIKKAETTIIKITDGFEDTLPKDEKFDYIIIYYALETVKKTKTFLANLKNMLKEDGSLLIVFYNISFSLSLDVLVKGVWQERPFGPTYYKNINFFTLKKVYNLLSKIGYKNISADRSFLEIKDIESDTNKIASNFSDLIQNFEAFKHDLRTTAFIVSCSI